MSEQNLASIVDSIEEIYRTHRRHGKSLKNPREAGMLMRNLDVTSTLTTLILEGTTSHSTLLDSFVAIHAALVSALQKTVGMEFGTLPTTALSFQRALIAKPSSRAIHSRADQVVLEAHLHHNTGRGRRQRKLKPHRPPRRVVQLPGRLVYLDV